MIILLLNINVLIARWVPIFVFFYGIQQQDQAEKFEYLLEESLLLLYKR